MNYAVSRRSFARVRAVVHTLDADVVKLHRDEDNNARYIDLDPDDSVSIRIDLRYPEDFERERAGLLRLAEVATQIAEELAELAAIIARLDGQAAAQVTEARDG